GAGSEPGRSQEGRGLRPRPYTHDSLQKTALRGYNFPMHPRRDVSVLRSAFFAALVFFCLLGLVYLGIVSARVVSMSPAEEPQVAAVSASVWRDLWCDIKDLFGFECPQTETNVEYAIITERTETTPVIIEPAPQAPVTVSSTTIVQ